MTITEHVRESVGPFAPALARNKLLSRLTQADGALLGPFLSPVDLPVRKVLEARNRPVESVYFLEQGLGSVVAKAGNIHSIEVGIIGFEGMTGLSVLLGIDHAPHETSIQQPGHGWRVGAADLTHAMRQSPTMQAIFLKFAYTVQVQTASTALANGRYKIEERLARWLLMSHDRAIGNEVTLTHELLALMLGIRRPGVTNSLNALERQGFIQAKRGCIFVTNRAGLEQSANGSYGAAEAEYERVFGAAPNASADTTAA